MTGGACAASSSPLPAAWTSSIPGFGSFFLIDHAPNQRGDFVTSSPGYAHALTTPNCPTLLVRLLKNEHPGSRDSQVLS